MTRGGRGRGLSTVPSPSTACTGRSNNLQAILTILLPVSLLVAVGCASGPNVANESGRTPLHAAARGEGDTDALNALIEGGADVSAVDMDGNTPLHEVAALRDDAALAELLLDAGADVNATNSKGNTPLHQATLAGEPAVVQTLLDAGAEVDAQNRSGETPLYKFLTARMETAGEDLTVARMLLEGGADPNVEARTHPTVDEWNNLLFQAIDWDNVAAAELLLEYGADVQWTSYSGTHLHYAVGGGSIEIAALLIEQGSDVNAAAEHIGWTPLHEAANGGDVRMVALLLGHGGEIDAKTTNANRYTPLEVAVDSGHPEAADLLLYNGADPAAGHYDQTGLCQMAQRRDAFEDHAVLMRLCEQ